MKKFILCAALTASALQASFAQEKENEARSTAQNNFSVDPKSVHHRHWVYLPKNEKMLIEVSAGYNDLLNLDSLLAITMRDIEFYKDSLRASGSVRIDYNFTTIQGISKMRFKKYTPDGDLFINNHKDIARLKIDQDTLCITIDRSSDLSGAEKTVASQVTFYLNNYADINELLQNKGTLNHIIDTLYTAAQKKNHKLRSNTSIVYKPFNANVKGIYQFRKSNILWDDEQDVMKGHGMLVINGSVGAGLVQNTIAPMAELGIELNDHLAIFPKKSTLIRVSAMPYFFFQKGLGNNLIVNDNWFASLELGHQHKEKRRTVGIGYLFAEKGGYFQHTTMKLFATYTLSKHLALCPEIILTNNFKQVYPGVTIRF